VSRTPSSSASPPTRRLRVGVCVGGTRVPLWLTLLLDDIAGGTFVQLAGIAIATPAVRAAGGSDDVAGRSAAGSVVMAVDQLFFGRRSRLLQPADLTAWACLKGVEVHVATAGQGWRGGGTEDQDELDVLLDLSVDDSREAVHLGGERSTWRVRGVPTTAGDLAEAHPQIVRAVLEGSSVVIFELDVSSGGNSTEHTVARCVCPTHPSSPLMTAAYLAASARQLIMRKLENLGASSQRSVEPEGRRQTVRPGVSSKEPGVLQAEADRRKGPVWPRFLMRTAGRQLRKMAFEQQWYLMVGEQPPGRLLPDPRDLRVLLPPPDRYWADPHVVEYGGGVHVFFEEFLYAERKGRIAVTTLDGAGRPGPVRVALDLDCHLSYPSVFVHQGRLFMVPEGAAAGSLNLYECMGGPQTWEYRRTLLEGMPLVDASLVEWQGRWWLFGSLKKPSGLRTAELLLLYSSDDPLEGTWREHPLSPLLADVTDARPAGAPMIHGGRLYRLAQDGTHGYGSGVVVNEVTLMDSGGYEERRVAALRAGWSGRVCGVHTLSRAGNTVVMDACRWVPRDLRRPRPDAMLD
jgi:hypothetical protein